MAESKILTTERLEQIRRYRVNCGCFNSEMKAELVADNQALRELVKELAEVADAYDRHAHSQAWRDHDTLKLRGLLARAMAAANV